MKRMLYGVATLIVAALFVSCEPSAITDIESRLDGKWGCNANVCGYHYKTRYEFNENHTYLYELYENGYVIEKRAGEWWMFKEDGQQIIHTSIDQWDYYWEGKWNHEDSPEWGKCLDYTIIERTAVRIELLDKYNILHTFWRK